MQGYPGPLFISGLGKYARLLVEYSARVSKGDEVLIRGGLPAVPLLKELLRRVLALGAHPTVDLSDDTFAEIFYRYASREQLEHVSPAVRVAYEEYDVLISVLSPSHTKALASVDPEKQAVRSRALRPLRDRFFEEAAAGRKRWSLAPYPTLAMAQEAGMTPEEFEEFVYRALKLHADDPIAAWSRQAAAQQALIDGLLSKADELRFVGPGIDLTVKVAGRRWVNDDGRHNLPGGEVFTGPLEDTAEGCVRFDFPSVYRGVEVEGVKLCFRRGEVVEYDAAKGRDMLARMLAVDEGARRVGELAFGLNYDVTRATREILFDEKIGGTVHIAIGSGYPETGSVNRSAIHWDFVKDMRSRDAKVYVDGELAYEAGRFLGWERG